MADNVQHPGRLAASTDPDGTGGGALFDAARNIEMTSPLERELLKRRIRSSLIEAPRRSSRRLRFAIVVLLLMAGSGGVGASFHRWLAVTPTVPRPVNAQSPLDDSERTGHPRGKARSPKLVIAEDNALAEMPPVLANDTASILDDAPLKAIRSRKHVHVEKAANASLLEHSSVEASVPPPPLTLTHLPQIAPQRLGDDPWQQPLSQKVPLPAEYEILGDALRLLRTGHDPRGALSAIERYAREYPDGALSYESTELRVEAAIELKDFSGAIRLIDGLLSKGLPREDDRWALRGELHAAMALWTDALADFDRVIGSLMAASNGGLRKSAVLERALWDRAVVRAHLGSDLASRQDLARYLEWYPRGRFAAEAATMLKASP